MTDDGQCAHPGCKRQIRRDRFACTKHWRQLPEGVQWQAWGAWESWQAMPGSEVARSKVRAVQAQALTWWSQVPA